ncbi:FmdB family transcriptional regulator [Mycobacterium sp. MYCO198283]|uniref:FmdB family zinc ribbon protein n=1 Tax=Mycobacterium sp. MYCO198283 TaxID=2883505 RepID=UPI001E54FF32|nr:FmdB family zinc ribbon protein [Mycobacterium sp. MYCO198283]MCG5430977.1 FmdB family transcriptional regulator [Mycobacterium sp. MYCO198283]
MPTYSYACTECGHRFDAVQSFSDDALTTCPECAGRLRKLFNSVGVVFKGSGFYRTDSRAGSNGGSSSSASESSSSTSSADGAAKTESKSEPKAETSSSKAPAATAS